jgi:hypothetical protein
MELLKQGKWLCMLLVISQSVFAQNTCPTIFHRNNGNGQSGDCPGVPGSSVPEATSVTGTNYSWSNLGLSVNAKEGDIGFQFPTALAPSLEPAIKTIWIGNTIVTDRKVGPPAPYDIVSSNKRFTYCFYNNNLPNVGSLTIEFVNPQTNTTYAVCSYDGSSSLTPPSISTNPSSETICSGSNASFSVAATANSGTLSYQWRKNGTNISGATNASYSISSATSGDAGDYDVIVSQSGNSAMVISNVATLTVTNPPTISLGSNPTTCAGTNGSLSYSATTNSPTTYSIDWSAGANSAGIADVTNSNLPTSPISIPVSGSVTAGTYTGTLTVKTGGCASTTYNISITVNKAPSITTQPSDVTKCSGETAVFSAAASGTPTPTIQWQVNSGSGWGNISNATNNSYSVTASSSNNGYQYRAVYTNTCGSVNANAATLTLGSAPTVSTQPPNTSVCPNTTASFTASASGANTMQWQVNSGSGWSDISGATNNSYSFTATSGDDEKMYRIVYTNSCGTTYSNSGTLSMNTSPTMLTQPSSNSAAAGSNITFSAAANGTPTPTVQWQRNTGSGWSNISGATNNSYTFTVSTNDQGYQYRTAYTNSCGSVTSNAATLTVNSEPVITAQPSSTSLCSGGTASFSASATGTILPTVQWQVNDGSGWSNVSGATNNTYSFSASSGANGNQYRAIFTNNIGNAISNEVTLTVNNAPLIVNQPSNATTCNGSNVCFSAKASASPTATVQWQVNDGSGWSNISGATNNHYSSTALSSNNGYQYRAIYTNTCGNLTTNAATLTVNANVVPSVSVSASATSICSGATVSFSKTATNAGSSPTYQWKLNGSNISGATNDTYSSSGLNDGDVVSLSMTSNASCASPATVNSSNTITMSVNSGAAQPGTFTSSKDTVYDGQVGVIYTVPYVSGVTYNWSYSGTGLSMSGSDNSRTIAVSQTATSGVLSVTATNNCGTSSPRNISVTVLPVMPWTCGNGNGDWNTAANWLGGFVPYATINVLVPTSASCQPTLSSSSEVRNLELQNGASISIPTGMSLATKGTTIINGTVCGGHLILNGNTDQSLSGKGTVCDLELDNGNTAIITSGDTIHVSKHYYPTSGVLVTNNGFELMSDATNGTATILAPGGTCSNYISGNVIVNKWIHGTRRAFRFLAHPFTSSIGLNQLTDDIDISGLNGSVNGFSNTATNNPSAFRYNTLTGNGSSDNDSTGWMAFTNTNGLDTNAWNPMMGARILIRGAKGQGLSNCNVCVPNPVTIDMNGPVNMCDVVTTLQANNNVGYNFVGNPYPSNIDMSKLILGSNVGPNFSVWDPNQGVYGAYVTQPFNVPYILPAYSAFFVNNTANTGNTITFTEAAKTADNVTGNLFKTTSSSLGMNSMQMHIVSNNDSLSWDRLMLFFDDNTSTAKDFKDADKLNNISLDFASVSSDGKKLAVDYRPLHLGDVVPLYLRADSLFQYAIRVDDYDAPDGIQVYLRDKHLNVLTPLTDGLSIPFTVTNDPETQGNRFELVAGYPTGINNPTLANDMEVKLAPNPAHDFAMISLNHLKGEAEIFLNNMMGQTLYHATADNNGTMMIPMENIMPGIYLLQVKNGTKVFVQKLVKE